MVSHDVHANELPQHIRTAQYESQAGPPGNFLWRSAGAEGANGTENAGSEANGSDCCDVRKTHGSLIPELSGHGRDGKPVYDMNLTAAHGPLERLVRHQRQNCHHDLTGAACHFE